MTIPRRASELRAPAASDVLDDLLTQRWSCRGYLPQPVPDDVIDEILAAAAHTPSWCNTQPWQVDLVSGAALQRLRAAIEIVAGESPQPDLPFPQEYRGAHLDRRRAAGWGLYDAVGVARGDRVASAREAHRNLQFFDAPHSAIISAPAELGPYGAIDCGLFAQSFLLAAQARGVATIPQAAIAGVAPTVHAQLEIPADRVVLFALTFGYPDPAHPSARFRTEREPVGAFTRRHSA